MEVWALPNLGLRKQAVLAMAEQQPLRRLHRPEEWEPEGPREGNLSLASWLLTPSLQSVTRGEQD